MTHLTDVRARLGAILLTLATLLSPVAFAQGTDPGEEAPATTTPSQRQPDPRFATPGATLETFDRAMEAYLESRRIRRPDLQSLQLAKECIDFGSIDTPQARTDVANDLFWVMSRIESIDASTVPDPGADETLTFYPDPDKARHRELSQQAPGHAITLARGPNGEWKIDETTAENAGSMQRDFDLANFENVTGQLDAALSLGQQVRNSMPPALRESFLTVEYWQWIAILLVIFVGVVLDYLVRAALSSAWHRIERRLEGESKDREILKKAVRPFGIVAAAAFWLAMINIGGISGTPLMVLLLAIRVILSVGGVWAAWRLTDLLADHAMRKAAGTDNQYDDLLIPLIQRTLKIFIAAMGVIYIAKALHIDVLPLLTGLGIGGLAVAFAAKDTIENFFGSVAVIMDQPFKVGDWIKVDDVEGTVEELGFRSTRVRTFYNSLVTVPNAMLVRATVDNYGMRRYRRWSTMINLTYDTPPEKLDAFCEGLRELIRLHPYTRKDMFHVYFNNFGAHSLDVLLYMFFECPDWAIELREKHRLGLDIIRLADRVGVEFAYPTQTLELKQVDTSATHTPAESPRASAETEAKSLGRSAARDLTREQPWKTQKPGPVSFTVEREDSSVEMRGSAGA
ncbi:MAG: mechanosensitive ion channel family protein [Phycisphaerales bacterium JB040]